MLDRHGFLISTGERLNIRYVDMMLCASDGRFPVDGQSSQNAEDYSERPAIIVPLGHHGVLEAENFRNPH